MYTCTHVQLHSCTHTRGHTRAHSRVLTHTHRHTHTPCSLCSLQGAVKAMSVPVEKRRQLAGPAWLWLSFAPWDSLQSAGEELTLEKEAHEFLGTKASVRMRPEGLRRAENTAQALAVGSGRFARLPGSGGTTSAPANKTVLCGCRLSTRSHAWRRARSTLLPCAGRALTLACFTG